MFLGQFREGQDPEEPINLPATISGRLIRDGHKMEQLSAFIMLNISPSYHVS